MSASTFVDSNVFLYAFAVGDVRHQTAVALLRRIRASGCVLISPQVVGEVYMNLRRDVGASESASHVADIRDVSVLHPLDEQTTDGAMYISERYGFDYWDSQIVAAALASGARYLLTEDLQDGQVIEGVTVVNPFRPGFDPGSLEA